MSVANQDWYEKRIAELETQHQETLEKLRECQTMLTAEELKIGRVLRGHTKIGCLCRYCKSVLGGRIVLHER